MARARHLFDRPVFQGALALAVLAAGVGLYLFQPWKAWQDETVREEFPTAASTRVAQAPTDPSEPAAAAPATPTAPAAPAKPQTLATGEFISHEHGTSGTVKVLRLPDGSQTMRLEGLDTSNGPDLHVWITDAPVKEGRAGWGVFDDGEHRSLGKLKGNKGDQNYVLPSGIDLERFSSVTIWCDRFNVSFGAAELSRV
ncbi:electron transporter [Streptomyces finlayi]|uniref:Electron transporter n=1 Tax=Streptomyces finlayi TaxID=67296 RepID=A0A7G7BTW8_9ACTN|nr:DM13 domain-containing protein [Streptomyces finlayi]QNE78783.1 electron transporter [Streptomyces finlayi]